MSTIGNLALRVMRNATGIEDFEKARSGWELTEIIDDTNDDFQPHCELCNQAGLGHNYVIEYPITKKKLYVGSKCIRRFVLFGETTDQEDSNRYFGNQIKKIIARKSLGQALEGILARSVELKTVTDFRNHCAAILECNVSDLHKVCQESIEKWHSLLGILKTKYCDDKDFNFNKDETNRIIIALFHPRDLPLIRPKVKLEPIEGMIKKRHRVALTLARSEEYKDPLKVIIDKEKE